MPTSFALDVLTPLVLAALALCGLFGVLSPKLILDDGAPTRLMGSRALAANWNRLNALARAHGLFLDPDREGLVSWPSRDAAEASHTLQVLISHLRETAPRFRGPQLEVDCSHLLRDVEAARKADRKVRFQLL